MGESAVTGRRGTSGAPRRRPRRRDLCAGWGFNGVPQIVATVEAYDPVANTWRTNVASINDGVMDVPMHHANVAVAGGKIYIVGFLTENSFTADGRVF